MIINENIDLEAAILDDGWWASVLAEEENRGAEPRIQEKDARQKAFHVDWEAIQHLFEQDEIISLMVTGHNRGGLLVEGNGFNGFVPCSHLVNLPAAIDEDNREDCFSGYMGKTLRLKVIECVPEENRIVLSERAAQSEAGKRTEIFYSLQAGQHVSGSVTNITEFGVFVDLGGVEGLIHISELSWGRVIHPGQIVKVGQAVDVMVLDVCPERCRIALSLKRLVPNPWETAESRYPVNAIVPAVITALVPFGAFARLEEGLEGLIHSSEIPLPPNISIKKFLFPNQAVRVKVIQVDAARQRLGLSLKTEPK